MMIYYYYFISHHDNLKIFVLSMIHIFKAFKEGHYDPILD